MDYSPICADNFGLTVYEIRNRPSAVFQIIGFTTQIYVTVVRGLPYCCYVYVYDSAGNLLGSGHVNEAGVAEIMLTNPSVVNAIISVSCNGYTYNYTQPILLGGDIYELYYWFEGPVLAAYTDILNTSFTGWLRVHSVSCSGSIYYIGVWLVNQTSTSTRVNITQVDAHLLVHPEETSLLVFTPGSTGWAGNVALRAELYYRAHCTLQVSFYFNYTSVAVGELRATLYIESG